MLVYPATKYLVPSALIYCITKLFCVVGGGINITAAFSYVSRQDENE